MARKSKTTTRANHPQRNTRTTAAAAKQNAIALLKADHRQVEDWFEEFESSRSESKQSELAQRICQALKVHTSIEEEIFYPAFYEATQEKDIHHEAEVEHNGAKKLIAEIEASGPQDDYFEAKVTVLSEMIKHHVREEEKPDGMFAKARSSDMDLAALGEQLAARKAELMSDAEPDDETPSGRSPRSSSPSPGLVARFNKRVRGE